MNHSTLGTPKLKQVGKGKWRLLEPFAYHCLKGGTITVPAGFECDGASSLGMFIKEWGGHYAQSVLVHDWLYVCINNSRPDRCSVAYGKGKARRGSDLIFREIMRRSKVAPLVRLGMFLAVRMFGGKNIKGLFVSRRPSNFA